MLNNITGIRPMIAARRRKKIYQNFDRLPQSKIFRKSKKQISKNSFEEDSNLKPAEDLDKAEEEYKKTQTALQKSLMNLSKGRFSLHNLKSNSPKAPMKSRKLPSIYLKEEDKLSNPKDLKEALFKKESIRKSSTEKKIRFDSPGPKQNSILEKENNGIRRSSSGDIVGTNKVTYNKTSKIKLGRILAPERDLKNQNRNLNLSFKTQPSKDPNLKSKSLSSSFFKKPLLKSNPSTHYSLALSNMLIVCEKSTQDRRLREEFEREFGVGACRKETLQKVRRERQKRLGKVLDRHWGELKTRHLRMFQGRGKGKDNRGGDLDLSR